MTRYGAWHDLWATPSPPRNRATVLGAAQAFRAVEDVAVGAAEHHEIHQFLSRGGGGAGEVAGGGAPPFRATVR